MADSDLITEIIQQQGLSPSFVWPVKLCAYTTLISWILSVITGNVSQVDRIWTFMPTIYTAYFALLPLSPYVATLPFWPYKPETLAFDVSANYSPRALLMFGLVFLWMLRLSYNTWRRGLFSLDDEDYRWTIVREALHPWLFQILNLVFIAVIQNIILFLLAIPTHVAVFQQPSALSISDYVFAALAVIDLAAEFTADNQQYSYQTFKHTGVQEQGWPGANIKWTEADKKRGFVTRGLWAWSRHPNFFCEQSFWVIITLMPLLAPERPDLPTFPPTAITPLWPLAPALVLCTLFFSSTLFSESISAGKYPAYKVYQQRVSMFVPFLTPVWGWLLALRGKKAVTNKVLWGKEKQE